MEKIEKTLKQLKKDVLTRKNKRMTVKLRTFLTRIGYKRRNKQLVAEVNTQLKKVGLVAYTTKRGWRWDELKMDEWVTFADANQQKAHDDHYARLISVKAGNNPIALYAHQEDAISALKQTVHERFSGILAIPTGGGKTVTAVRWLLEHAIARQKKILWLAHRHELLEQAFYTFEQQAYHEQLNGRSSFQCRIISGHAEHGRPSGVCMRDDVVIASKDSLSNRVETFFSAWLKEDEEMVVVIDEAHHATAKTYKSIIDALKLYAKPQLLGLTATPFRTAESEQGLLKKMFRDDLVYQIDLRTLIARGILSEPIFKELHTKFEQATGLTRQELQSIKALDKLPEHVAKRLAEHRQRNHLIVNEFSKNQVQYGKTLVFAINRNHAVVLNKLFQQQGFRTDYIISKSGKTNEENRERIRWFKQGKLDLLINVNMLTEGTDLPDVKTVLLTRPTTSRILMTQMIGRALRGGEAGGTEQAYIVSFTDAWKETIAWVNPLVLYKEEAVGVDKPRLKQKSALSKAISIETMEHVLRDIGLSTGITSVENIPFLETVPIGVYSFSDPAMKTRSVDVLVYDQLKEGYERFIDDLPKLATYGEKEAILRIESKCFHGQTGSFGYSREDISKMLRYYREEGERPAIRLFKDREKLDLKSIAETIYNKELGGPKKKAFIDQIWNKEGNFYSVYFGFNKLHFRKRLEAELLKLEDPGLYEGKEHL